MKGSRAWLAVYVVGALLPPYGFLTGVFAVLAAVEVCALVWGRE